MAGEPDILGRNYRQPRHKYAKFAATQTGRLRSFGRNKVGGRQELQALEEVAESTLSELRSAFTLMTDAEKTANANAIAGDRAMSGFLALMNAGADDVNKLRSAIENCDGTAIRGAETSQIGLNTTMAANPFGVVAAAIGLVVAAASELESHLDDCNEAASSVMATVGDLIDESQEYRDKADDLTDVIKRFDEITESEIIRFMRASSIQMMNL